jgi:release factor glutamine methyltransferase
MFVQDFFEQHETQLSDSFPGLNPNILLNKYVEYKNVQPEDVFLYPNDDFFQRVLEGIPLEHITETRFFYKHHFRVNSDVLIPRNETEILVEDAVQYVKRNYHDDFKLLEVGTGSGCIFLSILSDVAKPMHIIATDISEDALKIARKNTYRLSYDYHPQSRIQLVCTDRTNGIQDKFDLIVSNPPYIKKEQDAKGVHGQVLEHEPHQALFLPDHDYDQWFDEFFAQSNALLKDNGMLLMEGHEDHLQHLKKLSEKYFASGELKKDYTQSTRFLYLQK